MGLICFPIEQENFNCTGGVLGLKRWVEYQVTSCMLVADGCWERPMHSGEGMRWQRDWRSWYRRENWTQRWKCGLFRCGWMNGCLGVIIQILSNLTTKYVCRCCSLFQILPKVLSQVQSELSEECREPTRHAQIPGDWNSTSHLCSVYFMCLILCLSHTHSHTHRCRNESTHSHIWL